jgi:four helix bundle protein
VQSAEYRVQKAGAPRPKPAFYSLVVWQKAQALAAELVALVDALLSTRSASALGNQILRSGGSVAANIAEGYGRYSEAAYRNHLSIARGSLFETESWLNLLQRSGYITEETEARLLEAGEEIARLITATMKPLKSASRSALKDERAEYVIEP